MLTIVYVEDNYLNLDLLTRQLTKAGYQVHGATNGKKGLQLIADIQPDIILLDINIPDIDGYQLVGTLRQNPQFCNHPIIAVTANIHDRARCLKAGFDAHIAKPVRKRVLLDTLVAIYAERSSSVG